MADSKPKSLIINAAAATMQDGATPYGLIADAAIAIADGVISWVGPMAELDTMLPDRAAMEIFDARGEVVTPGLVDCHTHIVYGGNRAGEFEERLNGVPYEEISRRGGGIVSTVAATRAASEDELLASAQARLSYLLAEGVTTLEVKSGYGLDTETECKMLRVARALGQDAPVHVETSFLGAHALPPAFKGRGDDYIDLVCAEMLPAAASAGLADAVDGFCEKIAFDVPQTERVFKAAKDLGIPVKLHAEQLSNLGGARLAARYGAISADHLEHLDADGVAAMADAGTVAVLLPGAFYYLRETQQPPVALLREAGVPIAVATDLNPGSSPVHSILCAMNMACVCFALTPHEVVRGVTVNAARALGLNDRGVIAPGMRADLAAFAVSAPGELCYPMGANPCTGVWRGGVRVGDGFARGAP